MIEKEAACKNAASFLLYLFQIPIPKNSTQQNKNFFISNERESLSSENN